MPDSAPEQAIRILKKYPNRRLYDTELSVYVTIEDVRKYILNREALKVLDSRTNEDITRSVLLQIIADQEQEKEQQGHEPLLTNQVLESLIRFYAQPGYGMLGRFIEHSIATFLEQQRRYQRHLQNMVDRSPVRLMQQFAEQNTNFWRTVMGGREDGGREDDRGAKQRARTKEREPTTRATDSAHKTSRDEKKGNAPT